MSKFLFKIIGVLLAVSILGFGGALLYKQFFLEGGNKVLADLKNIARRNSINLDRDKVLGASLDYEVYSTVLTNDGNYSLLELTKGQISGDKYKGEITAEMPSGDLVSYFFNGYFPEFTLGNGKVSPGSAIEKGITILRLKDGKYLPIKIVSGEVESGRLSGIVEAKTIDAGYSLYLSVHNHKIDEGYITTVSSYVSPAMRLSAFIVLKETELRHPSLVNSESGGSVLAAQTGNSNLNFYSFDNSTLVANPENRTYSVVGGTTAGGTPANPQVATEINQFIANNPSFSSANLVSPSLSFLLLGPGSVTTAMIQDAAITAAKIATGAVTADSIALGTITSDKLASGVLSTTISDGSVTTSKLADSAVTSAKIAGNTIGTDKLSGTLTFGGSTLIDLSQVTHSSTSQQGLILPNVSSSSPSNPSSGKGYLAYDTADKQVLFYNGTAWGTVGSGTITSVNAGNGLSGGGSSGAVTLSVNTTDISTCTSGSTQKIIWDSVNNRFTCGTDQTTGGSASSLSSITAALSANTISNADLAQTWNWSLTTAGKTAFKFGESAASTATGNPYILGVSTLTGSTANPLLVTAGGTSNGIKVDTTGLLSAVGTGGIQATTLGGATFAAPGAIGGTTPGSGAFTTISASGQITSTVSTGTAPLVIASTTNIPNLNASSLNGATFSSPGSIGNTSAGLGAFTTLSASSGISANGGLTLAANQNLTFTSGIGTQTQNFSNTTGTANTLNVTNSGSSGTNTVIGKTIAITGTINGTGSNTTTGINFANVAAATNNTYNGITFGTGFNNYITSGTVNLTAAGALSGLTSVTATTFTGALSGNASTATTLATPRTIAGTSFDGSANISLANKFIVQGTTDSGLTGAQFLGSLGTGILKNTTTTGVLSIAVAGDFPTLNQNTTGTASNITGVLGASSFPALTGDVTNTQGSLATTISSGAVSLSKMANLAANSIIGNNTGAPATPLALTASQVKTLLAISTGDVSGLGTIATQNANNVAITGGAINGTAIGGTTPSTGAFTTLSTTSYATVSASLALGNTNAAAGPGHLNMSGNLTLGGAITGATATNTINGLIINSGALSGITTINASGQFTSTLATGTAPFVVASTTNVANLNASSLSGATFAAPGAIGGTTPSTGAFTTISATGAITGATATNTINGIIINAGAVSGISTITTSGAINGATISGGNISGGTLSGTALTGTGAFTINTTGNANGLSLNTATGASGNSGAITIQTGGTTTSGTSGNISIDVGAGATSNGTINIGTTNSGTITIGRSTQGITLPGFTGNNAVLYGTTSTGVLAAATTSTSGLCLLSGASTGFVPAWATCPGGGGSWSQLTNPSADLSLAMGANHTTFTWGGNTSTTDMFKLTDNATNTGTGYILDVAQVAGSTAKPLKITQGANTLIDTTSTGVLTLTSAGAATWGTTAGNLTIQVAGAGTSANVQIGAGGGGSTTPDFLVLDQDTAALPASTNGAMALDSTGKFNIFEGGAWKVLCNKTDAACGAGSGSALSAITAATAGNTINSGDNAQVWNWSLTTAGKIALSFGENVASTATGNPFILGISTLSTSTANPLIITAQGTANGVKVDTTGLLQAIGTGGIKATTLNGATFAAPGAIGSTTPGTGVFTTIGVGSATTPQGKLSVANSGLTAIGKALVNFDQYEGQDILTASASGVAKFTVSNTGALNLSGAITAPTATNTINSLIINAGALSGITTINASGQITSTLATGTAPFVVASTTNVANLNASSLNGATFAAPGAIGGGTPGSGVFTSLSATTLSTTSYATVSASLALGNTNAAAGPGHLNMSGNLTLAGAISGAIATNTINGIVINSGAVSNISTLGLSGAITGATATNTINGLIINSGALSGITTINASGQITSTVSTGTAPFVVSSTTNVANLNASSLNGATFASPGSIGSGTPGTGAFTTLSASGLISANGGLTLAANQNLTLTSGTGTLTQNYSNTTGTSATINHTNSGSSGTNTSTVLGLAITGTANGTGSNTITGLNFPNVAAATNNTYNGITFGTGFNNYLTSGTVNLTAAGALSGLTTLGLSGQLTSTVSTGTAPFVVSSTTNVANLNASSLNGATFAAPGAIGGGTPGSGAFTTISASGLISANGGLTLAAGQNLTFTSGTGTSTQNYSNTTGTSATINHTNSASSGTNTSTVLSLAITGTANAAGSNTITGLNFPNVAAATNNTYNGITFGTGFNNFLTSGTVNLTAAGAASGLTTLGLSGAITGATATNTINGIIINAGAVSGVSTLGLSGAITGATATNTINGIVINSGAVSSVTTLGASSTVTIGSGGNTYTFNPAAAPALAGTARPDRREELMPEYPGAVLTGTGVGTMTSDFCAASTGVGGLPATLTTVCNTAGDTHNYYNWTTSQGTAQTYSIWIKWRVPDNFSAWDTTNSIQAFAKRSDATNGHVNVKIYDTANALNNAGGTEVAGTANTWVQNGINITTGTWTAGSYATIEIDMTAAASGGTANVGEINLNYFTSN